MFLSRLEQSHSLEFHQGCVNAVNFNSDGNLIASGSDDFQVAIWDWVRCGQKPVLSYASGHHGNVFQVSLFCFFYQTISYNVLIFSERGIILILSFVVNNCFYTFYFL